MGQCEIYDFDVQPNLGGDNDNQEKNTESVAKEDECNNTRSVYRRPSRSSKKMI